MRNISIIFCALLSLNATAADLPDFPFVTVSGTANKEVKPDIATISFFVITFDKQSDSASQRLNEASKVVTNMLLENRVKEDNVTSTEISKSAKRSRDKDYHQLDILGYEFSQRFTVDLENLDNFVDISNALLRMDNIVNIQSTFDVNDRERIETEMIAEAAIKARKKAKQMAQGLGVEIDSVFAFNDTGSFASFVGTFGLDSQTAVMSEDMLSSPRQSEPNIFIPQSITIEKTVNVIYKVDN